MNNNNIKFYAFRANLVIKDISLYNMEYGDSPSDRNVMYRTFFEGLSKDKPLSTSYEKREYYLIYKNTYNDMVHCLISRKRDVDINVLIDGDINSSTVEDFPYVNVFFELKSQKIAIETNSDVFNNVDTCKSILVNILGRFFRRNDFVICINPIIKENSFKDIVISHKDFYKLVFNLVSPNVGSSSSAAKELANTFKDIGSEGTQLVLSNSSGKLNPNSEIVDSYVQYVGEGSGSWAVTVLNDDGKKDIIKSGEVKEKFNSSFKKGELNKILSNDEWILILEMFNSIEKIDSLKR